MNRHDDGAAGSARRLRSLPWLLAGVWLVVMTIRVAFLGEDVPVIATVAFCAVLVAAIVLWSLRLDRRAKASGVESGALFASASTVPRGALAGVPQFAGPLMRVRGTWLVGGWLNGRLEIDADALRWVPNAWTRRAFRAPLLELAWSDVEQVALVASPGPRQPGVLGLKLRNDAGCGFMIVRRGELGAVLAAHRTPDGQIPLVESF